MAKLASSTGAASSRAAKRTRSASAPADRASRVIRNPSASSSTALPSKEAKTKITKKTIAKKHNASARATAEPQAEDMYVARAILDEDAKRGYLIDWAGVDAKTGKAYEPTWEPRRYANAALKREWKEKKDKKTKKGDDKGKDGTEEIEAQADKKAGQNEAQQDGSLNEAQVDQAKAVPDKTLPDNSRKQATPKRTASKKELSIRGREPKDETQKTEPQDGNKPDQPSIHGRGRKRDTAANAEHNNPRETSGPGRKRKRNTDTADARDEPSVSLSQPQPDNKKQRREAAKPTSTKPDPTKPDSAKPVPAKPEPEPQSDGVFPARAITGERSRQYRVAWENDPVTGKEFEDTWEPKSNVSKDLVAEWKQQKKGEAQKAPKKQRGRPPKKSLEGQAKLLQEEQEDDVYSARAVVGERHHHYLVAWEKDPKTGEEFDDTWEPKSNVSRDLVAEWRQMKKRAPNQQEQLPPKSQEEPKSKVPSESVDASKQTKRQAEQGEQQQKQNSITLPTEPVTPRRDDDEEEEDDEVSCPPSSTMKHNIVPVTDDTPTDKRRSEEQGITQTKVPANATITQKRQVEKAPGVENASPFWEEHHKRSKAVVLYGTKGRRLLTDLQG